MTLTLDCCDGRGSGDFKPQAFFPLLVSHTLFFSLPFSPACSVSHSCSPSPSFACSLANSPPPLSVTLSPHPPLSLSSPPSPPLARSLAQAGRLGAVTVATNMAGRGTDILLGGSSKGIAKVLTYHIPHTLSYHIYIPSHTTPHDILLGGSSKGIAKVLAKLSHALSYNPHT